MAVNGTDTQIDSKVANKFADLVSEASNGNVTISVYPNDQLASGNATKGIEMLAVGAVDLAAYATSVMAVLDEKKLELLLFLILLVIILKLNKLLILVAVNTTKNY